MTFLAALRASGVLSDTSFPATPSIFSRPTSRHSLGLILSAAALTTTAEAPRTCLQGEFRAWVYLFLPLLLLPMCFTPLPSSAPLPGHDSALWKYSRMQPPRYRLWRRANNAHTCLTPV